MEPMNPTKTLPEGYRKIFEFDLKKNILVSIVLNVGVLFLFVFFGWMFVQASFVLRPAFWEGNQANLLGNTELISYALALILMIVLHEGAHGFFFWRFTGDRPFFGLSWSYAYAAAPDWYLPRNQYLVVGLAPLALLSLGGLVLLPFVPLSLMPGLVFLMAFNAAGSVGDMFVVGYLLTRPASVLINDVGNAFSVYGME